MFLMVCVLALTGCQTIIPMRVQSDLNPNVGYSLDDTIIVLPRDESDFASMYVIPDVVQAFKERGFKNVFPIEEYKGDFVNVNTAFVKVDTSFSEYEYSAPVYGSVNTGSNTTCTGFGNTTTCNTYNTSTLGVVGSKQAIGVNKLTYFALHLYNYRTKERTMYVWASTFDKKCSSRFLQKKLAKESLMRVPFNAPSEYDFKLKLKEGEVCK